jgi:hypothetical protein
MMIAEKDNVFYIGENLVECLTGNLSNKVFEVIASRPSGEFITCNVQANNIDEAQKHVENAARNDKVRFSSFKITLLK